MNNFIKKVRKRPRPTRLLILWLATFLVMVIIIAIWLASFSKSFHFKETKKEIEAANLPSLFKSIGKDFSIIKQRLEAGLKGIEEELPSESYEK